jgi:hypothetical protein
MKIVKIVFAGIGVIAVLLGFIWILQGYNILPGSFMTGDMQWAYRGMGLVVAGALLLFLMWRRRAPPRESEEEPSSD